MKYTLDRLVLCFFIFLLLMSAAGSFSGVLGDAVYLLAFLLPTLFGLYLFKGKTSEEIHPLPTKRAFFDTLPFYPIAIALIFLLSFLTSLLLGALGLESETVLEGPIVLSLLTHALLPALCEELLFRCLFLKALLPHGKRKAVLVSALLFSLAHCSLFQIPYAFVAGVLLALVDILSHSLLPSLILHLTNNALGVLWLYYGNAPTFTVPFFILLALLLAIAVVALFYRRAYYEERLKEIFLDRGTEKVSYSLYLAIGLCLFIAFTNLL